MHMPLEDTLGLNLLAANQHQAEHNQEHFQAWNVLCLNLMSSPGAGKTALLERSLPALAADWRMAVLGAACAHADGCSRSGPDCCC